MLEKELIKIANKIDSKIDELGDAKKIVEDMEHEEVLEVLAIVKDVEKSINSLSISVSRLNDSVGILTGVVNKMQVEVEELSEIKRKGKALIWVSRILIWVLGGIVGSILYFKDGILFLLDLFRHNQKV